MTRCRIIMGTPINTKTGEPINNDPQLHHDLKPAELGVSAFRTVAAVLRCGERTPSKGYLGGRLNYSPRTVERHLKLAVEKGWLTAKPITGNATSYVPGSKLCWGKGFKMFVPARLDDLGLNADELYMYYGFLGLADNETGEFTLKSDAQIARDFCVRRTSVQPLVQRLLNFGLLGQLEPNRYRFLADTFWAAPNQLAALRNTEAKHRSLLPNVAPPCSQMSPPLSLNVAPPAPKRHPSCSQMSPNGKQINSITSVVKHDDFRKAEMMFEEALGEHYQDFKRYAKSKDSDIERQLQGWGKAWGTERLRAAFALSARPTRRHVKQGDRRGQILTFYDALTESLDGREDDPSLQSLSEKVKGERAMAARPKLEVAIGDTVDYHGRSYVVEDTSGLVVFLKGFDEGVHSRHVRRLTTAPEATVAA